MPTESHSFSGFYDRLTVCQKTTLSPTTLWRRVRDGKFPPPVRISDNRVAWPSAVVDAWIAAKSLSASIFEEAA